MNKITFKNKTFCFTGKFLDLERENAEELVKQRGGLIISERVNKDLDYLVIGSKPSNGWKFGDFGNKINDALYLREEFQKPIFISEDIFLNNISDTEIINTELKPNKILFIRMQCKINEEDILLIKKLENSITEICKTLKFHYTINSYNIAFDNLFDNQKSNEKVSTLSFSIRIMKFIGIESNSDEILFLLLNKLNELNLESLTITVSERQEGSILYAKLYKELNKKLKIK